MWPSGGQGSQYDLPVAVDVNEHLVAFRKVHPLPDRLGEGHLSSLQDRDGYGPISFPLTIPPAAPPGA